MLSRKQQNSPIKENVSPDRQELSPRKHINDLKHLIQLLKQHNISIPQQLIEKTVSKQKIPTQIKLKQVLCDNTTQIKNLRVQLSDIKFQLKKTEQDFAEYKVITRMQKQKIIKKYLSQIQQLKKKLQDDNNNWQKRYTEMCKQYSSEKIIFEQKINSECKLKIQQQSSSLENKYQQKITQLQKKAQNLNLCLKQQQKSQQQQKLIIIQKYEQKAKQQIQALKTNTSQKQKQITQRYENRIQTIYLERKIDTSKFEDIIQKLQHNIKLLENDKYFLQKQKEQLKNQIKTKERKIIQLQIAIRAKEEVSLQQKQLFQLQKKKIHDEHQAQIKMIAQNHLKDIKQIKKDHLNEIDAYYLRINNLEQRKLAIQSQYKEQMKILEKKFSQRVSKSEDMQEIQRLNTILILKDREISRYQQQLKSSELIRQNNEKNYSKLFNSSRRKSSNTYRDRDVLNKQSNTTDIRVLLKICNKQF